APGHVGVDPRPRRARERAARPHRRRPPDACHRLRHGGDQSRTAARARRARCARRRLPGRDQLPQRSRRAGAPPPSPVHPPPRPPVAPPAAAARAAPPPPADPIDIYWEVPLVPQVTGMSCWAAAAAMLIGWRDSVAVDPEEVARSSGRWAEYRDGLEPGDVRGF